LFQFYELRVKLEESLMVKKKIVVLLISSKENILNLRLVLI